MALLSIRQFAEREPVLGGAQNIRAKVARGVLDDVVVRLGGRIYIDPDRWEALKRGKLSSEPTGDRAA
jgi:hypothetical protein